jgi:outer membrane biogenesis lipoprotein LolB
MLARVRKLLPRPCACSVLLASAALALSSCATKQEPVLVSDGTNGRESALPWNQQQKWENAGQFGALADQMQQSRR